MFFFGYANFAVLSKSNMDIAKIGVIVGWIRNINHIYGESTTNERTFCFLFARFSSDNIILANEPFVTTRAYGEADPSRTAKARFDITISTILTH